MELQNRLNHWVERGLISADQRSAILAYESNSAAAPADTGHGRIAEAISTVGAAVAIAAVAGIITIFVEDWSATGAMVAATTGAVVMIAAARELVRNGWGAPAGLCALCGLALIPLSLGCGANAAGWWPEHTFSSTYDEVERGQQRLIGSVLLLSIPFAAGVIRIGLRQAWTTLPLAIWYGTTLLFTNVFENIALTLIQAVVGPLLAAFAVSEWRIDEHGRGAAWWLQIGGLLLAAQAVAFSAFEDRIIYSVFGLCVAAVIFAVGAARNRTVWMVAGAIPAVIPAGRVIFEYFEGVGGLLAVAIVGMLITFLPLLMRRRHQSLPSK